MPTACWRLLTRQIPQGWGGWGPANCPCLEVGLDGPGWGWDTPPSGIGGCQGHPPAHPPKHEFRTPPGLRKELGWGLPPGCRQDPNHKPRTTAGWSSGPTVGKGRGKTGGWGIRCALGAPLVNDPDPAKSHQLGVWNHVCLVPGTSHGRRGQELEASVGTEQGPRHGAAGAHGAAVGHLLWKVICKGKVMRGIWCFPRQLLVRGLTPHSGGRYGVRGGYGGSASQGVQDTNLRSTSVCPR